MRELDNVAIRRDADNVEVIRKDDNIDARHKPLERGRGAHGELNHKAHREHREFTGSWMRQRRTCVSLTTGGQQRC